MEIAWIDFIWIRTLPRNDEKYLQVIWGIVISPGKYY